MSPVFCPWRREVERGGVDASPRARLPPRICRCCCRRRLNTASSASDSVAVSPALPCRTGPGSWNRWSRAALDRSWLAPVHWFAVAARAPSSWPPPPSARCTPVGSAGRRMPGCLRTLWGARYLLVQGPRGDSGSRGSSNSSRIQALGKVRYRTVLACTMQPRECRVLCRTCAMCLLRLLGPVHEHACASASARCQAQVDGALKFS